MFNQLCVNLDVFGIVQGAQQAELRILGRCSVAVGTRVSCLHTSAQDITFSAAGNTVAMLTNNILLRLFAS